MKNKSNVISIVLTMLFVFSTTVCFGQSSDDGKTVNNAAELKAYLDSQPANTRDKPIKIAMNANDLNFIDITRAINTSRKYVSLDLSGSPITSIPDEAFWDRDAAKGCETLVSITIPSSVTSISIGAFFRCTSLTSVTIPNSVTSIGQSAFYSCTNLTSVTIPNSVTSIGGYAFYECNNLTSLTIGNSVTSIGQSAFFSCTSLTSVTIPNSVTSIGMGAFSGCYRLTSVTFQGTIPSRNLGISASSPFNGDLRAKYLAGGRGTYTTTAPVHPYNAVWTK